MQDGFLPADGEEGTIELNGATLRADYHAPLRADPRPDEMCIFLHALRCSLSSGAFEAQPPKWAEVGWRWGQPLQMNVLYEPTRIGRAIILMIYQLCTTKQ
jgi:hypothetical protein